MAGNTQKAEETPRARTSRSLVCAPHQAGGHLVFKTTAGRLCPDIVSIKQNGLDILESNDAQVKTRAETKMY